ncbi:MAG: pyridoxamine 5'-phosphate oxidase family protein [Bacteroidota bacterium]
MKTDKTKVKRIPKRGFYDQQTIFKILDSDFVCQIGFIHQDYPVVIPTIYGRKEDNLYFHGSNISRMLQNLEKGLTVSINVTQTKSIVLARSAIHHSLNYNSVTIFGKANLISDVDEKIKALKIISDQIIPGRWEEVRPPNKKELDITKVLQLKITEASAKVRDEGVNDDRNDYELDIWAGLLPIEKKYGKPINDSKLKEGINLSESVNKLII